MDVIDNGTSMVGTEEEGSSSMASTPPGDSFRFRQLNSRLTSLELENQRLKKNLKRVTCENWKVIHFITASPVEEPTGYFDKPVMTPGLKHDDFTMKAFLPVTDVGSYVKQTGLDFVVSRFYSVPSLLGEVRRALGKKQPPPEPIHYSEHIQLQSQQMLEAMQEFLSLQAGFWDKFPGFNARAPIQAPYIFWYMYRSPDALQQLQPLHRDLMLMLTSWIDDNYAKKYAEAGSHLERGVVTLRTMPFLACPGDVLIWKEKRSMKAAITCSLLSQTSSPILYWDSSQVMWSDDKPDKATKKGEFSTTWSADAWNFKFTGEFFREKVPIQLKFKASSLDQEVEIAKLAMYPLRFADETTRLQLETRGRTFWSCRIRNLVSYTGNEGIFTSGERFMVDFQIYKELHRDSLKFQLLYEDEDEDEDDDEEDSDGRLRRKMSPEEMESDTPPSDPDIYVFPDTVPGYNLRSKKWVDLEVDRMTDVKWNKKSFENLVIDAKAKEMIQALVTHQIESEKGTDLIHRKGNGLIILLHGGPGTGKTFTAETVAEIAQKPLFCVTCGDIGTKPEDVEKYLESVLYLGKTWGCVVLIDEAEVFLEQRSLENLERNALVSVFLRVLEYYEGILVLTTNRVGTFDEAFKSRILLSLHYEKLTKGQRRKIWRGFINHLEDTHRDASSNGKDSRGEHDGGSSADLPDIDYQEILDSLDELASHELNGRQIRNIITTARQLAKFRGKTLNYGLLEEVISLSGKFDEYFRKLNENQSDEQIARSDGLR
ncbi:AAA family ATPase [Diaporthe sp. PMI_573]|nr:AAA family ATPase [Diaporthaceae sp. PMI_573]